MTGFQTTFFMGLERLFQICQYFKKFNWKGRLKTSVSTKLNFEKAERESNDRVRTAYRTPYALVLKFRVIHRQGVWGIATYAEDGDAGYGLLKNIRLYCSGYFSGSLYW